MAKYKIEGMDELLKTIKQLEQLPNKCVSKAARAGAKIPLSAARSSAPFLTGELSSSIYLKAEKTRKKGKKVFQVTFRSNPLLVRISANGKRYYYPSSMEYGFKTKSGGKVQGLHYMRKAMDSNSGSIERTMVNVLANEIDKL